MRIGTKSVLYGYHCWFIHPFFVAWGWYKINGFLLMGHWQLWLIFFVHDLGYWGKPNMDGPEGEEHVLWGARLVHRWTGDVDWYYLCVNHSRYWAKKTGMNPSALCFADKLAFLLYPEWLCFLLYWLTGEWREYAEAHKHEVFPGAPSGTTMREWFYPTRKYMAEWVETHMDGKEDTWTKAKPV